MPTVILDNVVVEVQITNAELLTLLSQKAQDAGLIDFVPTHIEFKKIELLTDPRDPRETGWEIRFTGDRS